MKTTYSSLSLFCAALALPTAFAATCPCFSEADLSWGTPVTGFTNGVFTASSIIERTTYQLRFDDNRRFTARDNLSLFSRGNIQNYYCELTTLNSRGGEVYKDPTRRYHPDITKEQYEACADLIQFAHPDTPGELQDFDDYLKAANSVTVYNVGTQKYLGLNRDGGLALVDDPTEAWQLTEADCPSISSAADNTGRTCFTIAHNYNDDLVLTTNGAFAFTILPPTDALLGAFVLDPTVCSRAAGSCTAGIRVAFYQDRVLHGPVESNSFLPIASDSEVGDFGEWIINTN